MGNCPTCGQFAHLTRNNEGVATCHACQHDKFESNSLESYSIKNVPLKHRDGDEREACQ